MLHFTTIKNASLYYYVKCFTLLLLVGAFSACTLVAGNNDLQLPIQYATLKLIEQADDVNAEVVLARVTTMRRSLENNQLITVRELVQDNLRWENLDPSDRLLINRLTDNIEQAIADLNLLGDERRLRLGTYLDWIEEAAMLAI